MTANALVEGAVGKALQFDGINDKIIMPVTGVSSLHDKITVSFWAYGGDALPANTSAAFEMSRTTMDSLNGRLVLVHLPWSDEMVYFDAPLSQASGIKNRVGKICEAAFYKGTWTNWAFTKDSSTGWMRIYRNGTEWANASGKTESISGIAYFTLGSGSYLPFNWCYPGALDEFEVSKIERSPDWIKLGYMNQKANDALVVFK